MCDVATNKDRASWAKAAVDAFAVETGTDAGNEAFNTILGNLLVDLMHLCHQERIDFANMLRASRKVFQTELEEELGVGASRPANGAAVGSAAVIDIDELDLHPVGSLTDGAPESVMKGTIQIGTGMFHVETYQVVKCEDGEFSVVNPHFVDDLLYVYGLSGSTLTSIPIKGREYVLTVFPFAS